MKKKYISIVQVLLFSLFLMGCIENNKSVKLNNSSQIHFDTSTWDEKIQLPDNIVKNVNFIPLETDSNCLMGDIGKILSYNERWYITDGAFAKTVYVFQNDGKFLFSIGKYGRGVGEFNRVKDFTINKKKEELLILDKQLRKVLIFDLNNGIFKEDVKLSFRLDGMAMVNSNLLALYSKPVNPRKVSGYSIRYLNLNNKSITEHIKKDDYDTVAGYLNSMWESESSYYAPYFKDIVYKLEDDKVEPAITFNFEKYKMPPDLFREVRNNKDFTLTSLLKNSENWCYGIGNVVENSDLISLTVKIRNKQMLVLYSKKTGNYHYGSKFEGKLNSLRLISHFNIARDGSCFLGFKNALDFKRMIKNVNNSKDEKFKQKYMKIYDKLSIYSNPVIVSVEYTNF